MLARGEGKFGNALRFVKRKSPLVFFEAEKNFPYSKSNWSGSVSFWLGLDPETELEPGYTDPIQITPRDWNTIPWPEKPLVSVERPPFAKGKWTHIVFTFENFNAGQSNGVPILHLDGKHQGQLSPRIQTFTWDPSKTSIMLGLSYIGLWDELSIFNRALTPDEVRTLNTLRVTDLLKK